MHQEQEYPISSSRLHCQVNLQILPNGNTHDEQRWGALLIDPFLEN